ncbi:MAG TPA: hypothetical protein VLK84_04360 [Longimicrobium sp.]|nr:hypothetical protein [Longimicrobium sp.]
MMRTTFCLLLAFFACARATAASAQGFAYPGIAWGDPADSVRARLEAQGFSRVEVLERGDQAFVAADSSWLRLEVRENRTIGVTVVDTMRGAQVAARFAALADSFRTALGEPDDTTGGSQPAHRWVSGFTWFSVRIAGAGDLARIQTHWRGPGWYDEMERRSDAPELLPGFTVIRQYPLLRLAVDTAATGRRTAGGMRGRFRIEYEQPITPKLNGVDQAPMDAVEYEMELDCRGRRARLIARATYLQGRLLMSERPDSQAWSVPQPGGHYARGLESICAVYRRR